MSRDGLRLGVVAFLVGAGTLSTEISASRLLAPYFGASTVVWANIIGLTLAYLALGYWLGGRLADRRPEPRVLARVLLVAAAALAVTPFAARPLLRWAVEGVDTVAVGSVVGSFFAAVALFAVPVTALGAAAPFLVRLALDTVEEAGRVAGRLYALSTAGSLAGTFLAALVLIPSVGTQRTLVLTAACVALGSALLVGGVWAAAPLAAAALLAIPTSQVKSAIFQTESPYQYIRVVSDGRGGRALELNEGVVTHSAWRPDTVLTGRYWDLFLMLPPLLERQPRSMLVVGNAGGTIGRAYGAFFPGVSIDGVELDPQLNRVARRWFGAGDNPDMRLIAADGRPFLERARKRYDLIVVDAYRQPYVPFYLATSEFFRLARRHLAPGGAIALNVATTPTDRKLSDAVGTTLRTAFPQAWRWRPLRYNDVLFALREPVDRRVLEHRAWRAPGKVARLLPLLRGRLSPVRAHGRPLTDDRAPVEWLTDRMILHEIERGGGHDEIELPTAPSG
ncbi:MAG TPA: fused MFS/spermidine synthase [Gaiellaceae bacterium]|nr:fused MFS/spermidine synthase [Gaiellaceae bacterium]